MDVLTPPNNKPADFEDAPRRVNTNPDCKDITIFMILHGGTDVFIMGGERYTAQRMKEWIETSDELGKKFKVLLGGCKTGSFVDDLTDLSNVEIIIAPTDANTSSYGDWDRDLDPNPDDKGSEFTSGLVEDLNLLMSDPSAIAQMQQAATDSGRDFQAVLYYCAFESAVAKDATAINGDATPIRDPERPL